MKREFVIVTDPKGRGRAMAWVGGPHGEAPGWTGRQREQENMARRLWCGFHRKDQVKRVSRLRTS